MINDLRFELSFKNIPQLENLLNFCKFSEIRNINIPCKGSIKKELLNSTVNYISKNFQEFNVTYHYSLFHQYSQNKNKSYEEFLDFFLFLNKLIHQLSQSFFSYWIPTQAKFHNFY